MGYRKWRKKGRLKRGFAPSLHLFGETEVLGARLPTGRRNKFPLNEKWKHGKNTIQV